MNMVDISIDMMSVGNADAIIVWLKDDENNHYVVLIDGGNKSDAPKVIEHLDRYVLNGACSGKAAPDLIIATHHDNDHIGGLIEIVKHYKGRIGEVWVNNPAEIESRIYYNILKGSIKNKTKEQKYKLLQESIENLDVFIKTVDEYNITRKNALAGRNKFNDIIKVLGPSEQFYKSLLPGIDNFDKYILDEAKWIYKSLHEHDNINEEYDDKSPCPIVDEENTTSATNNSSVIVQIKAKGGKYMFTGDAGVTAFEDVQTRYSLENIYWLDVPHHGSRRNLTSLLIKTISPDICYISAVGNKKHPRRALVNCLKKHGATVYSTHKAFNLWYHRGNFPDRPNYSKAEQL